MDELKRGHEEHVAQMAEMKAEHEERMDKMERLRLLDQAAHEARMGEMDRQTFTLTGIVGRLEKDHAALVELTRAVHGRLTKLEKR